MRTDLLLARIIRISFAFVLFPAITSAMPPVLEPSATLTPADPRYTLTESVAIDGDYAVVGYQSEEFDIEEDEFLFGHAPMVYHRNTNGTWQHMQTLTRVDYLGHSPSRSHVAMRGNVIAFSALGVLHVFERTASGWQSVPVDLVAGAPLWNDIYDIEIDNGVIVVAAVTCERVDVHSFRKHTTGVWRRLGALGSDPANCQDPGQVDAAISGDTTLLAAPRLANGMGAVYFMSLPPYGWNRIQSVEFPQFQGWPVAISGDLAILAGSQLYQRTSGVWVMKQPLDRPEFGFSSENAAELRDNLAALAWYRSLSIFQGDAANNFSEFARLTRPGGELTASSVDISGRRVIANDMFLDLAEAYIYELPATLTQPAMIQETFQSGSTARWTSVAGSNWSVATTPMSRVYRQASLAGNATALLNNSDWTNQSIQADIKPTAFSGSDRWFGLAVRHSDANNYYYLTARSSGVLQLKKIVNGVVQTLGSTNLAVNIGNEYRLRLEAIGTTIRVYLDGAVVLQAVDSSLRRGQAALMMYRTTADYDNVIASPSPQALLFAEDDSHNTRNLWTSIEGQWGIAQFEDQTVRIQSSTAGGASSVTGYSSTSDQSIRARVQEVAVGTGTQPWFGLFARYRDANNYYYVTVRNSNEISLRRQLNGSVLVLDSAPFTVATGTWYTLRLEAIRDQLRVYVNGRLILEATDTAIAQGRYGAIMYKAASVYDDVMVTQP